jgi:uncharacterized membrane protein YgdD (TMEM256/DUF423 family)
MTFFQTKPAPNFARLFSVLGALSSCASVVLGAVFAHLPVFSAGVPTAVQIASSQQQVHSLGLLVTGLATMVLGASRWWTLAGCLMLVGLFLFSFNLYARHVWGFDALRAWVPWGGAAWILAWFSMAIGFTSYRTPNAQST